MEKKEMLENLEYALRSVLCKDLDGIDKAVMASNVELFIRDRASQYTEEELVEKFYTPEMSIKIFMDFLAETGALDDPGDQTIQ